MQKVQEKKQPKIFVMKILQNKLCVLNQQPLHYPIKPLLKNREEVLKETENTQLQNQQYLIWNYTN